MQKQLLLWSISFLILIGCNQNSNSQQEHEFTNELINENSPYLLQHAHNPVNWYPWGDKALDLAKKENKLMIISIGYAACHWCHVMEHESFEDTVVARQMNETFVSIKVDREERTDIDQVYMDACQLMNESCGWPLNIIALPNGKPIFAGTYYPKEQWLKVLEYFSGEWKNNPQNLVEFSEKVSNGLVQMNAFEPTKENALDKDVLSAMFKNCKPQLDWENGGQRGAPKFPVPIRNEFFLNYYFHTKDEHALLALRVSLDAMAEGGIYDQVGGGFSRYSVDGRWHVPHFEKMLYDNAQLVSLYSKAYQLTKKTFYKQVAEETLAFVERELYNQNGGFYSSLDADSEGEEGKYYVWRQVEVNKILGKDAPVFNAYFHITEQGNWEHFKNILYFKSKQKDVVLKQFDLTEEQLQEIVANGKKKLFEQRQKRVRPNLDDKILTAWNALMLKGYVDAYRAFGNKHYLEVAEKNATFIQEKMMKGSQLFRNYKDGNRKVNAFLDDYSLTIEAFTALYQVTFNEKYLFTADKLMQYVNQHFYDAQTKMYFYTSDQDPALISRKMQLNDNVIPSSNASIARGLYTLGTYLYKKDYLEKSRLMVLNMQERTEEHLLSYANWGIAFMQHLYEPYEVAVVGENYESIRREISTSYLPNMFLLGGRQEGRLELLQNKLIEGKTYIYVCQKKVCKRPVQEVEEALEVLKR